MENRVSRLREFLAQQGLDGMAISQPENQRYLSGFTGGEGVVLITPSRALLATDFRYYEQVRQEAPGFELVEVVDPLPAVLGRVLGELGVGRLGFEAHVLTVETFEQWKTGTPGIEWVPAGTAVERLRQVKDAAELQAIEEAVRLADEGLIHIMRWARPGVTERQVAWELESYIRTHGAERLSFTTIIGSGPNGAMSHAVLSDRAIGVGDPLVMDLGAVYNGYCSDLTRSFCLGSASAEYRAIWDTVRRAQEAAEAAIRPGLSGVEADAIARKIIYDAGYEGRFGHGLGHGVGLAIHEDPRASMRSPDTLQAGMILTVEPGIYFPGWGGVRIEDMVVVTESGCRVLTQAPKVPVVG
jgi:Xaa-Pro aminopeptidase